MRNASVAVLLFFALVISGPVRTEEPPATGKAKYVFLFIGDGTSFAQRHAAELFLAANTTNPKSAHQRLVMNTFPVQGLSTTHSADSLVTDSASSATAIATGHKTINGFVGASPTGGPLTSIAKIAKKQGKKVGVITSVSIDHATPAAFYATYPDRRGYYEIALQAPLAGFDYFAGGGFKLPNGNNGNQKNIFDVFRDHGYRVANSRDEFDALLKNNGAAPEKILAVSPGLDEDDALPYAIDRKDGDDDVTLAEFVNKGIQLLDNDAGFFMMIEGGKIDWACHANDAATTVREVIAFDEAVAAAHEFYKKHPDETLIVVTGDHETGGMAIGFTGTGYAAHPDMLGKQKGSYAVFEKLLDELKAKHAASANENAQATFMEILPPVFEFFGLELYEPEEFEKLWKAVAEGKADAREKMKTALQPYEMDQLVQALVMSWEPVGKRPRNFAFHLAFGGYDPLAVTMTRILSNKAGIGWTTFVHSGLPTPVSAIGAGAEVFGGHYDNTDIFGKITAVF